MVVVVEAVEGSDADQAGSVMSRRGPYLGSAGPGRAGWQRNVDGARLDDDTRPPGPAAAPAPLSGNNYNFS